MATEESKRKLKQRKRDHDQVSFLIPKGGRRLLRVMAIKERCTAADVIRRAIMARAGLERVPDDNLLDKLDTVNTRKDATSALIYCQTVEHGQQRWGVPWWPAQGMTNDEIYIMKNVIIPALEQQKPFALPTTIKVSKNLYMAMCRLLSRLEVEDDDDKI